MVNELMRRRAMLSAGKSLPYDAEVDFLQSSGTQYIETGYIPDNTTGIEIIFEKIGSITTDTFICGERNDSGNTRWVIGNRGYAGWEGFLVNSERSLPVQTKLTARLNYLNSRVFETPNYGSPYGLDTLHYTPTYNIRLFGSAGVVASYSRWAGKLFGAKISQSSDVVMDLIPVRVGTTGYMYDKVSGQLFGNAGSDPFILGNDIN